MFHNNQMINICHVITHSGMWYKEALKANTKYFNTDIKNIFKSFIRIYIYIMPTT